MGLKMSWLDIVTAFLGAMASGDYRAAKQLVSDDVEYKDGIMELKGFGELNTIIGPAYKMRITNWAYKNKLVFIEYTYWDYTGNYSKECVGIFELNDMAQIKKIRMYNS